VRAILLSTSSAVLLTAGAAAVAQTPQPFVAPPHLAEKTTADIQLLRSAAGVPTGPCKPDGDISHDGNVINLRLVAERTTSAFARTAAA